MKASVRRGEVEDGGCFLLIYQPLYGQDCGAIILHVYVVKLYHDQ